MKSGNVLILLAALLLVAVATLAGCGGGGTTPADVTTGSVSGYVKDFFSQQGIGSTVITIGGQTGTSDSTGYFIVNGIQPGGPYTVTVTPPSWAKLLYGLTIPQVTVTQNNTYQMPGTIWLVNASEPDPPVPPPAL
jgi:hypothetical protein